MRRSIRIFFIIFSLLGAPLSQPANANILISALKFLSGWLAGRVLDSMVDRQEVRRDIAITKEIIYRDRQTAMQNPNLDRQQLQEVLQICEETQRIVAELERRLNERRMTDEQIRSYFQTILERRVAPLEHRIEALERRMERIEDRVDYLDDEVVSINQRLAQLARRFKLTSVASIYYHGFSFVNNAWGEAYPHVPARLDSVVIFSGAGASFGFWFNRLLVIQGELNYIFEQNLRIKHAGIYERLSAEGFGWTGSAFLTLPASESFGFDVGGGYAAHDYQVGYWGFRIKEYLAYPFGLLGIRIGADEFSVYTHCKLLLQHSEIKGYHLQAGMTWKL